MTTHRMERLQVMLDPQELKVVDDWRFDKRMPSRAAAIRELIRRGLIAEGFKTALAGKGSTRFGVIDTDGSDASSAKNGPKKR